MCVCYCIFYTYVAVQPDLEQSVQELCPLNICIVQCDEGTKHACIL